MFYSRRFFVMLTENALKDCFPTGGTLKGSMWNPAAKRCTVVIHKPLKNPFFPPRAPSIMRV